MRSKNVWFFFFLTAAISVFGQTGQTNSIEVDAEGNVRIDTPNLIVNGVEYSMIPVGAIIMWSGPAVPDGWALCDGASYQGVNNETIKTPNLSGRFIVGYAAEDGDNDHDNHKIGNTGGLTTVTLTTSQMPSHNHTADPVGNHSHTIDIYRVKWEDNQGNDWDGTTHNEGYGVHADNPYYTGEAGYHTHSIQYAGGNAPHENRPPYYVLAYIMKIKGKVPPTPLAH